MAWAAKRLPAGAPNPYTQAMDVRESLRLAFEELAELTVLDEQNPQAFRVRAYENAAQAIRSFGGDLQSMPESQLSKVPGIGKSTAKKIRAFIETGSMPKLDDLREKFPPAVVELSRLPGVGPKSVARLREELGVESIADLDKALKEQRVRSLAGFGAKSEEKLAQAIERLGLAGGKQKRTPIGRALPVAERIVAALRELPDVEHVEYCGSLRRMRETIGDLDIVVSSTGDSGAVMKAFVELPVTESVVVRGDTKTSILTREGLQVDLRVVTPDQLGAALLYFTGSKAHNIKLRQRALERGWTLNEYSLSAVETGEAIASEREEDIYQALGLTFVPPPMREDAGEVERAANKSLPDPVGVGDLLGDCHVHTERSGDAKSPLSELVAAAKGRGYTYLAVTDHAEDMPRIGIGREQLREQREEIARLQDVAGDLRLLQGIELNIGPEGSLDYDPDFRMELDLCVAAIHSHFDLDQASQTKRLIKAMEDPSVQVIGHLSSRQIGRRPGIDMDIDAILDAAAETKTAIEINSALGRLDASSDVLRRAFERDVLFVISSDAHHTRELDNQRFGALHAQRGWVRKEQVVNTWSRERFLAWVAEKRGC